MSNGHSAEVLVRVGQRVWFRTTFISLLKKAFFIIFCIALLVWGVVIPLYPKEVVTAVRNFLGLTG